MVYVLFVSFACCVVFLFFHNFSDDNNNCDKLKTFAELLLDFHNDVISDASSLSSILMMFHPCEFENFEQSDAHEAFNKMMENLELEEKYIKQSLFSFIVSIPSFQNLFDKLDDLDHMSDMNNGLDVMNGVYGMNNELNELNEMTGKNEFDLMDGKKENVNIISAKKSVSRLQEKSPFHPLVGSQVVYYDCLKQMNLLLIVIIIIMIIIVIIILDLDKNALVSLDYSNGKN